MMTAYEFSGSRESSRERRVGRNAPRGSSILELIIVILVIAFLISLLLPAVETREAPRRTQCVNNLKQLALGCLNYESANRHFPTNGWGSNWLGDPNRGVGITQPGGWLCNILPYIEETALYNLQKGKTGAEQAAAATKMAQTPLFQLYCPSRRPVQVFPFTHKPMVNGGAAFFYTTGLFCDAAGKSLAWVAKSDYAGNGGQRTGRPKRCPATPCAMPAGRSVQRSRRLPIPMTLRYGPERQQADQRRARPLEAHAATRDRQVRRRGRWDLLSVQRGQAGRHQRRRVQHVSVR